MTSVRRGRPKKVGEWQNPLKKEVNTFILGA